MNQDLKLSLRPRGEPSGNNAKNDAAVAAIRQKLERLVSAHASAAGWTGEDVDDIARRGTILFFSALSSGHTASEALEHAAGNAESEYAIEFVESAPDRGEAMEEAYEHLLARRVASIRPIPCISGCLNRRA
ncbi:MAG: hypothetical protein EXR39_18800 [Betaproteobacteria bacterium]|nr:hypothetical protein [Betaproteobacteria bacterium]